MTIRQLQEQETRLADRINRLNVSLAEAEKNLTEQNIPAKAEEIHSLEIQLQLTEKALASTQEKLREQEKFLSSKEYKDKLKMQEKLTGEATKQAGEVFEELQKLLKKTEEVEELVKQAGKLERETTIDKRKLAYSSMKFRQPFSWLYGLKIDMQKQLKNARFIKDKLEV